MKSIFNQKYQHDDLDAKLVLALERLSHVFRLLLWEQTKKYNLSPLQTQVLVYIFHQNKDDRNITSLSQKLNVTKATLSDAVKSLESKKLISKKLDKEDYRYQFLQLTKKGEELVKKIEGWSDVDAGALVVVQLGSHSQGGMQVATRQTTGPTHATSWRHWP